MTNGQFLMDITGKYLAISTFKENNYNIVETEGEFNRVDLFIPDINKYVEVKFRQNSFAYFNEFYVPRDKTQYLKENIPNSFIYYAWTDCYTMLSLDFVLKHRVDACRVAKNQATLKEGITYNYIIQNNEVKTIPYNEEQKKIITMFFAKELELRSSKRWFVERNM